MYLTVNLLEFSTNEPSTSSPEKNSPESSHSTDPVDEQLSIDPSNEESSTVDEIENTEVAKIKDKTYEIIPFFYHKLPKSTDALAQKLREEARTLFLQKRSKELLDNNELVCYFLQIVIIIMNEVSQKWFYSRKHYGIFYKKIILNQQSITNNT